MHSLMQAKARGVCHSRSGACLLPLLTKRFMRCDPADGLARNSDRSCDPPDASELAREWLCDSAVSQGGSSAPPHNHASQVSQEFLLLVWRVMALCLPSPQTMAFMGEMPMAQHADQTV